LATNDFPPVCAMTGRPAETWRRFKFSTPPGWAYALLILVVLGGLGFILFAILVSVVAQRAGGYLPLTRSSSRTVALATWVPVGLLIGAVVLWFVAIAIGVSSNDPTAQTIVGVLFFSGLFALGAGLLGRLVIMPLVCPRARVSEQQPYQYDKVVELRNVNPAFVAAVHQLYAQRVAQSSPAPAWPTLPQSI
jgi:hypothetical protein